MPHSLVALAVPLGASAADALTHGLVAAHSREPSLVEAKEQPFALDLDRGQPVDVLRR